MNASHDECWQLLPWVVTGRISARDRQHVEHHLLECHECRDELEQQRSLCELVRRDAAVLLAPQASLQKLMSRIDASAPADSVSIGTIPSEMTSTRTATTRTIPRWLSIAAAVQTLAIATLLTLLWQQHVEQMNAPRFTTLSSAAALNANGPLLRVVFKPEMTTAQLQSLLHSVNAQIVSGPTEAGVYSLLLDRKQQGESVAHALDVVRASPTVIFAEHVSSETKP